MHLCTAYQKTAVHLDTVDRRITQHLDTTYQRTPLLLDPDSTSIELLAKCNEAYSATTIIWPSHTQIHTYIHTRARTQAHSYM